jgi:hypothetical protein
VDQTQRFQQQWFGIVLLGAGVFAVYVGLRISLRRELDNPLVTLRGGKALALGLALVALGIAGAAMGVREGLGAHP